MVWSRDDGQPPRAHRPLASAGEPVWDRNGALALLPGEHRPGAAERLGRPGEPHPHLHRGRVRRPAARRRAHPLHSRERRGGGGAAPVQPGRASRDDRYDASRRDGWRGAQGIRRRDDGGRQRREHHGEAGPHRLRGAGAAHPRAARCRCATTRSWWRARPATLFVAERVPNQPGTTLHRWEMAKRKAESFVSGRLPRVSASQDGKKLLWQAGPRWVVCGADGRAAPRRGRAGRRAPRAHRPRARVGADLRRGVAHRARLLLRPQPPRRRLGRGARALRAARPLRAAPRGPHLPARHARRRALGGALLRGRRRLPGDRQLARRRARRRPGGRRRPLADRADLHQRELEPRAARAARRAGREGARPGDYLLEVDGVPVTTETSPGARSTAPRSGRRCCAWASGRTAGGRGPSPWCRCAARRSSASAPGWRTTAAAWTRSPPGGWPTSGCRTPAATPSPPSTATTSRSRTAQGAVIDERFNGGGLLDDYMVGIMTRRPVGGVTTNVPGAPHTRLPASGILGPKVLVTNELAGSGGDYFPWVFRQMGVGPLVGTRTWGGLVNAAVPYPLVDGGSITSPAAGGLRPRGLRRGRGGGGAGPRGAAGLPRGDVRAATRSWSARCRRRCACWSRRPHPRPAGGASR